MSGFFITDEEWYALHGASDAEYRLYFTLRKYADVKTGLVGSARKISWQSLREEMYVEPRQGLVVSGSKSPDQLYRLAMQLKKRGLLTAFGDENKKSKELILKLEMLGSYSCDQNKPASKPRVEPASKPRVDEDKEINKLDINNQHEAANSKTAKAAIPQVSRKEKEKEKPPTPFSNFPLPEWLDPELWAAFIENRKNLKSPMTLQAQKLGIGILGKLVAEGQDPKAVVEQSIFRGWKTFYAVKENFDGRQMGTPGEATGASRGRRLSAPEQVRETNRQKYPCDPFFDPEGHAASHARTINGAVVQQEQGGDDF